MLRSEFDYFYENGYYGALTQFQVTNAVILAAGCASRFRPLSETTPKALLRVKGEILIERLILQLIEAGIPEIYVVIGHKKELFYYLEGKFGVHLVENPDYRTRNNHASLYAVREHLANTYICPADNYFMENIFSRYVYQPYHAAVYQEGTIHGYSVSTGFNGRIARIHRGGSNAWQLGGECYWNRAFSKKFISILESEYDLPQTIDASWETIYTRHLDALTLYIRRYPDGVVRDLNNLDELCRFDPSYMPYRDMLSENRTGGSED